MIRSFKRGVKRAFVSIDKLERINRICLCKAKRNLQIIEYTITHNNIELIDQSHKEWEAIHG